MATFTLTLKQVLAIEPDIGLSTYPIYDEAYRAALNQKIIDHFWNREIGQETIEMFKLSLRRKMNEIMPLYNLYYQSNQLQFDPLQTINVKTFTVKDDSSLLTGETKVASTGSTDTETDGSGSSSSDVTAVIGTASQVVEYQTPQTMLSGNEDYATGANKSKTDTTNNTNTDENSVTSEVQSTKGKNDSLQNDSAKMEADSTITAETSGFQTNQIDLLIRYRESFINVDMMVIEKLENIFMLVWDNGDAFTERPYNGIYSY